MSELRDQSHPVVVHGHPERVEVYKGRWAVRIVVVDAGLPVEYVASADSADTGGDGIWFGTLEEWRKQL